MSTDSPRGLVALLRAVPTCVAMIAACMLAWQTTGSIRASAWLPYAIGLTLVLAVVLLAGAAVRPSRLQLISALLLVGFATWTLISALWAPSPALARNDGFLALLYAITFLTPLLTLRTRSDRLAASALTVGALTVLAVMTAVWLRGHGDPALLYSEGRLDFPVTYWNGQAAIALIGFWPAIALAARLDVPALVRSLALGGATGMLALWLGTQSKGGGIALVVSAIVVLAISQRRLRLLVPALVAGGLAATGAVQLTEPFRTEGDAFDAAVRHAGTVVLVLMATGAMVGLVYALVDQRLHIPRTARRWVGVGSMVVLIALTISGLALFFARVEHPVGAAQQRWHDFTTPSSDGGSSHFSQLGSNRYDFWRVAWHEFQHHPLAGVGAFGWSTAYLVHRRSGEAPRRSHSIEMDALSETGIIGFLLIVGAGLTALVAVGLRARHSMTAVGALGAGAYFTIHTGGDWVWTMPVVGIPAMLLVGIGAAADARPPLPTRLSVGAGFGLVAVAAVALMPPWLSHQFVERAYDSGSAAAAASDLRWARRLDPLAIEPLMAESGLADPPANLPALLRAVEKQPRVAELRFLLGIAYLEVGRRMEARVELRTARELSPKDEAIRNALREAGG